MRGPEPELAPEPVRLEPVPVLRACSCTGAEHHQDQRGFQQVLHRREPVVATGHVMVPLVNPHWGGTVSGLMSQKVGLGKTHGSCSATPFSAVCGSGAFKQAYIPSIGGRQPLTHEVNILGSDSSLLPW